MIGVLVSDVSPAVTTPVLVNLKSAFPSDSVVNTLTVTLLTASNVNSVIAIHAFYTLFSFTFHTDSMPMVPRLLTAVAEVVVGAVAGLSVGLLLRLWRFEPKGLLVAVVGYGLVLLWALLGLTGGGAMACLFLAVGYAHGNDASEVEVCFKWAWEGCLEVSLF